MDWIDISIFVSCSLSILGSSLMIFMYKRLGQKNNFALGLICYMSISDLIFSTTSAININPKDNPNSYLCSIQGVLLQFSALSCFIFCFELMICIYLSIICNYKDLQIYKNKCIILGFVLPAIISLIPLGGNLYGNIDYSCGFQEKIGGSTTNKIMVNLESSIFFYIPLWFFNTANVVLIFYVVSFIRGLRNSNEINFKEIQQDQEIRLSQRIILNMLSYPIIMMVCWSGFTIYKIGQLCGYELRWLEFTRFILPDLIGFLNSIAYIINHFLFEKLKLLIQSEQQMHVINQNQRKCRESFRSFISSSGVGDDSQTELGQDMLASITSDF